MNRIIRLSLSLAVISAFFVNPIFSAWAKKGVVNLEFHGNSVSADLDEVPLKLIFKAFEKEARIRFHGNRSVFGQKVSVQFNDLSLEIALKRILAKSSYSFVYGGDGALEKVFIMGQFKPGCSAIEKDDLLVIEKEIPTGPGGVRDEIIQEVFQVIRDIPPPNGPIKLTSEEIENFKVEKNLPPPGGPVEVSLEELGNFKVEKNLPPPGGPAKVTTEDIESFRVADN